MEQIGPGVVWDSRLLRVSALLALISTLWFGLLLVAGPVGPVLVAWLLIPASMVPATLLARRASRDPRVSMSARRFWRQLGTALAVFALSMSSVVADAVQPDLSVRRTQSTHTLILHGIGFLLMLWPLLRLPVGVTTRARKFALGLDIGILLAGVAIILWHFTGRSALALASDRNTVISSVFFLIGSLIMALTVAKVAITGSATLDPRSLRMLGGVLAIGAAGSSLAVPLASRPYLDVSLVVTPVAAFALALAARQQVVGSTAAGPAGRVRHYSLLPYLVAAITDTLLVITIVQHDEDQTLVAAAAVAVTALVILRQLAAFRENDKLLTRLDAGLTELSDKERHFRLLVQNSTDVVTITGPDGTIKYISPAVRKVLGSDPGPLVGTNIAHRMHPDDRPLVRERVAYVVSRPGATAEYRVRLSHADGSWRWLEIISANLLDEPSVAGIVSNSRDVTETLRVQERLSYEATHDVLTGLANRALFGERVQASVASADARRRISIVLIDLDDFKTVNDTLGHAVGDGLLVMAATRMRSSVRPSDTVARLGGDEFAILFEGLGGDDVDRVLIRIADALLEPMQIDDHLLSVRASFGVVDGRGGDDAGNLLRQADIAMYEAKERGEGGHQRYRPGMEARGVERSRLVSSLRTALTEEQLRLYYQPVVRLPDGRITGAEALIRWQHPTQGLLGPGAFIEAAEETGLIEPIGRWVLREAVRQAARWQAEYGDRAPATISVNASAQQLRLTGFATEVAQALRDAGLPARRLTIEITESMAVGGGATQQTLAELRELGVRISLDDFGTGASTLGLLATCPVDELKLDRSFVPGPGPDAIARAVLQLAQAFELEVVAEGVETAEQAAELHRLGYHRAQGFHFARPLPAAAFATRLDEHAPV